MRHSTNPLVLTLAAAALLGACSEAGSTVEPVPSPDPGPAMTTLQIDFGAVTAVRDCDGIEGAGDFRFRVIAEPSYRSATTVYNRGVQLRSGQNTGAIGRRTFRTEASDGRQIAVEFRASEVDQPLIGAARNDSRMDNRSGRQTHRLNNGRWSNLGPKTIRLGSGDCLVQLDYTVTQVE